MFADLKIRWKFLLSSYAVLFVTGVLITFFVVNSIQKDAGEDIASFKVEELEKKKQSLKNYVDIAYETIDSNYRNATSNDNLIKVYGKRLRFIVDAAQSNIKDYVEKVKTGEMSLVDAQLQAMNEIKRLRYDNGKGYIWINDTGQPYPKMIMHPTAPALNGKVLDNSKYNCANGKGENLFKAFVDVTRQDGEGFVDYLWAKPSGEGLTIDQPKLSYVRLISEWDWIIGTGVYVDDALVDAVEKTKLDIKKMRYDSGSGYFWINDTGQPYPKMVMHPTVPALDGKVLDNPKYNCALHKGENLFRAMVDVTSQSGEGFVDYMWSKPTEDGLTEEQPKLSYVRLYEPLGWIIGTGIYIDDINAAVARKEADLKSKIKYLLIKISATSLVVSFFGFAGLLVIAGRITKPIIDCAEFSNKMGEGNLDATIEIASKDEIGLLAMSLKAMGENLKNVLFNISTTSQSLADGASSQAAAVEEASASLEEMAAMTKQNAENANQGDMLIRGTQQTVTEANQAMGQLAASMQEINEASQETQKIVKTIDEIAFQTNLLALNAAVEAARAGEAGAGFAVVADEVRNLAMRAADAARNTADLIEGTVTKVEDGDSLATSTGNKFSEVAENITKVSNLVSEITQASNEQASGVNQLNLAMADINNVTQQNVSTAQELVNTVCQFSFDDSHAMAAEEIHYSHPQLPG